MPRGGRRPGAGAPRGNLNALKHGRHSAQLRVLLALFHTPAIQSLVARLIARQTRRHRHLHRHASALGLCPGRPDRPACPPPIALPTLRRRQTLRLARTIARLRRTQEQSTESTPKTALPDTAPEENPPTQSKLAGRRPRPNRRRPPPFGDGPPASVL